MYATFVTPGQEELTEDPPVIEEIRGNIVGEQIHLVTHVCAGVTSGPTDPTWDATKGLSVIRKDDLTSEETVYVSVAPSDTPLPPPGQYNPRELTAASASTEGHSAVWDGVSVGPCVQTVSDAIALGMGVTRVVHLGRIFGLVAGEFAWIQERTSDGEDGADVKISGRLMCAAQVSIELDEVIEGTNDTQDDSLV